MPSSRLTSSIMSRVGRWVLPLYRRKLTHFERSLGQARREQQATLERILRFGADTAIGRDFGLRSIRTREEFRRQLPIAGYDHFAPYIERVAGGEFGALFPANEKLLTFVQTSATTGHAKIFPINSTWFRYYSRDWDVWGVKAYCDHPEMIGQPILNLAGPWSIGRTSGGFNIAIISAMIEKYQSPLIKLAYALPEEMKQIPDISARGYCSLRLAASSPLGLVSTVTPSQILQIAEWAEQFGPQLVRDLHQGTLSTDFDVPAAVRSKLSRLIRTRHVALAQRLEQSLKQNGILRPRDIWRPALISCWLGGTVGHTSRKIPELFGHSPMRDQGLLSTEGRHTIPLADNVTFGPLAVGSSYYEFIPADEEPGPQATVLEAHELEPDRQYRIIMTTIGGLYRYDIGDIVKCVGYLGEAPLIEFLQKSGGYCDMAGEKLSAYTVCQAALVAQSRAGLSLSSFTVAPLSNGPGNPRYAVLVETQEAGSAEQIARFLQAFDAALSETVLIYGVTRKNRILESPVLMRLPTGEWRRYIAAEVARAGGNENQYKHKPLVSDPAFVSRLQVLDTWIPQGDGRVVTRAGSRLEGESRAA